MMHRVFHHRFSIPSLCGILLFAVLTFYFLWQKMALVALPLAAVWVLMIERVLHTTYTLTDSRLIISRGRFARVCVIDIGSVIGCHPMSNCLGLVHYVLIEYGDGRTVSVQPQCELEFIGELYKRIIQ